MSQEKIKRTFTGTVVSDANDKTIVVKVERLVKDLKYGKYLRRTTKLHAHDEKNECRLGDLVEIQESRPYSKMKTWTLVNIIKKAE